MKKRFLWLSIAAVFTLASCADGEITEPNNEMADGDTTEQETSNGSGNESNGSGNESGKNTKEEESDELSNSSQGEEVDQVLTPDPYENSNHGYLLEDNRIPRLYSCEEWEEFWFGLGPAISFDAADKSGVSGVEVSTEIYLKNKHLDENGNGIVCLNDEQSMAEGSNETPFMPPLDPTPVNALLDVDECKLFTPNGSTAGQPISFPMTNARLPSEGNLNIKVIPVDFEDVAGDNQEIEPTFSNFNIFVDFIDRVSFGKLSINLTLHPNRVFVPAESGSFGMQEWTKGDAYLYFTSALKAADKEIDFSEVDAVVFVPPMDVEEIVYGPVSISAPGEGPMTNEGPVQVGAVGGADLFKYDAEWIWLAHEMGHALGLPHIYYSEETATIFDTMYWGESSADFIAWNKWRLGWLERNQIRCADPFSEEQPVTSHRIGPLSGGGEDTKAVIMKLSEFEAIVFEHRTHQEFDTFTRWQQGLFAYKVDTRSEIGYNGIDSESQAVTALVKEERYRNKWMGTLSAGEDVSFEGLEIEVKNCNSEACEFEIDSSNYPEG